jgi:hypothetical protein
MTISEEYLNLKIQELYLSYEYSIKKQIEKEEQQALRARLKEEEKVRREIEAKRALLEKERNHFDNNLKLLQKQLEKDPENDEIAEKITAAEKAIADNEKAMQDVDYREANQRAGYVYIISNIGAFGENVYKIGMTRRLDPQERVDELGDASVPFIFDVHAMIFSEDAPKLEAALHNAFADRKINMVNKRREFFRVTLDEIKAVISENFDKTVEWIDIPDADQYRISEQMRVSNT